MPLKIKNWKLALLSLVVFCLFVRLGVWQLDRAAQKRTLLAAFAERTEKAPLTAKNLNAKNDLRFYRATLKGRLDNSRTLLLDNKTFQGQVGYEVYSPFHATGLTQTILIDRGFVPAGSDRRKLPLIPTIIGTITITGMLNEPPTFAAFGPLYDEKTLHFPLRIEYLKLNELGPLLTDTLFPYVLSLEPKSPYALPITWEMVTMGPEKHMGYAVQWFAFALTLLILFAVLNWDRSKVKTK